LEESPEDEEERNRELAREYYRLARRLVETEQFHAAHELLRDATRRDPRPEYFGLLGQVQARNPNWLRRAVESYRKAVELAPNSVDLRLGLAMTCERAGYGTEAKLHYENVLARSAGDPTAQDALRRLRGVRGEGDGGAEKKSKRGFLSRLFARGA
jgi:cytochrome c-type biogenesis protein CcmH/NrfG